MNRRTEEAISLKLKYIAKISLVCGVMSTAVALSGCGSSKAVQANAAVVSRSSDTSNSSMSSGSSGVTVSSDLVSHSAPSVSSAVVTSSKPSTGSQSTSHQAPASPKPTGGVTRTSSAAPRPASVAPRPASRPASTAPTPRPTSTAPVSQGISARYHGATYGCDDNSQYSYVLSHADVVGSSRYNSTYSTWESNQSSFESMIGVPYSADWNKIVSIMSCFSGGTGSASSGSAYSYFTGANRMCGDKAKAMEAALHEAGYNARLALGTENGYSHMWVQLYKDSSWYNLTSRFSTSLNAGYSLESTGYNL